MRIFLLLVRKLCVCIYRLGFVKYYAYIYGKNAIFEFYFILRWLSIINFYILLQNNNSERFKKEKKTKNLK